MNLTETLRVITTDVLREAAMRTLWLFSEATEKGFGTRVSAGKVITADERDRELASEGIE